MIAVMRHHYGAKLPDDDAGRDWVRIFFDHYAALPDARVRAAGFVAVYADWLAENEFEKYLEISIRFPRYWTSGDLGKEVGLTFADRQRLRVTQIAPCDMTEAEFRKARRRIKTERQRERRKAAREAARCDAAPCTGMTERRASILKALSGKSPRTPLEIRRRVRNAPCWRNGEGDHLAADTFRRVLNRDLSALLEAELIECVGAKPTKWRGEDAKLYRLKRQSQARGHTKCVPVSRDTMTGGAR